MQDTPGFVRVLLDNIVALVAYAVLSVVAWLKLGDVKALRREFEAHKQSPIPHPACPVHAAILDEINKHIGEVKEKLDVIDARVYDIAKNTNGGRDDKVQRRG